MTTIHLVVIAVLALPQEANVLRLEEVNSWEAPDSFRITGFSTSDEGDLVIWSASAEHLFLLDGRFDNARTVLLPPGLSPQFVAMAEAGSIELLAEGPVAVYRVPIDYRDGDDAHRLRRFHREEDVRGS